MCSPSHDQEVTAIVRHSVYSTTSAGSVRSPDSFSSSHVCWGAAVAGLHLYTNSFTLTGQRGVQEGRTCGGIGARWQDPWRGAWVAAASSSSHHRELVRSCSGGVVQVIRWRGGLERPVLSLVRGVCRVGGRQVGVVPPCRGGCHGCRHGDTKGTIGHGVVRGGVGEGSRGGRIVDTGVWEAGVRQGGKGAERSV